MDLNKNKGEINLFTEELDVDEGWLESGSNLPNNPKHEVRWYQLKKKGMYCYLFKLCGLVYKDT